MVKLLLKPGKNLYTGLLKSALVTAGISCFCATGVLAKDPTEGSSVGLRRGSFMALQPPPSGTNLFLPDTILHGIRKMDLRVSGTVRFLTIYRDMSQYYADMQNSPKNIAFTEYSSLGGGTSNTGGVPNVELLLTSKYGSNANFNVGYSFLHSFTGATTPNASSAKLTAVNNLWFSGNINTEHVKFGMSAGSVLWTNLSRFTMGQPIYRDNYFYRQPWDWYRQSFTRWEEYYSLTSNVGTQGNGNSPLSGFVGTADFYKAGVSVTGLFGRTNRTVAYGLMTTNFPAFVSGGRVQKSIYTKAIDGRFGLNYYRKDASTTRDNTGFKDVQEIISLDGRVKWKKIIFSSEVATGLIDNPSSNNKRGYGFFVKADADKRVSKIPIGMEYYRIGYDLASLDGGILNSNTSVHDGGYPTEYIYDNMQMINIAQEVGQVANNRQGIFLNGEAQIEKFKIQLGMGISQELENRSDTVTIQHRVNALARSRFRPWFNAGGPYGRIKSGWQRTFETITITDTDTDYKKGFNNIELLLKYKFYFLGMDLVLLNFHNFNSIQDKLSPIPIFTDAKSVFVRQYFTDLTIAYRVSKKTSLSFYGGVERLWGSGRVDQVYGEGQKLIYDSKQNAVAGSVIKDAKGKIVHSDTGLNIDQTGYGFGAGIDYDFSSTAGLHLRHTRMFQSDKNFIFDRFKGSETNLELKIFF